MPGVHLPADVELEDRLAFGFTGRQLAIFTATAVAAYGAETLLAAALPLPLALAGAVVVGAAGSGLALLRRDGLRGDELVLAFARFALAPRTLLLAPDGLPAALPGPRRPGALEPPVTRIYASGLVERADGSYCLLLRASGTTFALRDAAEQAAFVAAFGRFLNGLEAAIQIQVAREPASLEQLALALEHDAAALPAGLAAAALDHARYLRALDDGPTPPRRRRILLVLATATRVRDEAEAALARGAEQARQLLAAAGVGLTVLEGDEVAALLASALAAPGPPPGARLEGVVRGSR